MPKKVFRYGTPMHAVLAIFLFVFAIGFGLMPYLSFRTDGFVVMNEQKLYGADATAPLLLFGGIGLVILGFSAATTLYAIFSRIEIEGGELRQLNWLNRVRLRAFLSELMSSGEETKKDNEGFKRRSLILEFPNGTVKVSEHLVGFLEFQKMVTEADSLEMTREATVVSNGLTYVPKPRVYRYLFSRLHLFSFPWLAGVGFGTYGFFTGKGSDNNPAGVAMLASILFFFGIIGLWMMLTGFIEMISLGPQGISWRDWKGKLRVHSSLDDIIGVTVHEGEESSCSIETKHGLIRVSSQLRGFRRLRDEITKIVESRS